jgi:hypothetical protein
VVLSGRVKKRNDCFSYFCYGCEVDAACSVADRCGVGAVPSVNLYDRGKTGSSVVQTWQLLRTDPAWLREALAGQGSRRLAKNFRGGQSASYFRAIRYTGNQATATPSEVRSYRPLTVLSIHGRYGSAEQMAELATWQNLRIRDVVTAGSRLTSAAA